MFSKQFFMYLPLCLALLPVLALAEPAKQETRKREAEPDFETFQKLLAQVDPPSLHAALHDHSPKFKHGMFQEDKTAIEFIHRDDAPLATSIIKLAKRQDNTNGTLTSAVTPPEESSTPSVEPTTPSTSDDVSDTATATPTPLPNEQSSEDGTPSSTESTDTPDSTTSPVTITSTGTEPAPDATSDANSPPSSTSSEEAESSRSAGSVFTFTNSFGAVVVTTVDGDATTIGSATPSSTPEPSSTITSGASVGSKPASRSSIFVRTTTLPDGKKSVVTAVTVVPGGDEGATPTGDAGVASGTRGGTAAPGLQTGVAVRTGSVMKEMLCMIGGAVGVAMLM